MNFPVLRQDKTLFQGFREKILQALEMPDILPVDVLRAFIAIAIK
jgi:hypothetical protein